MVVYVSLAVVVVVMLTILAMYNSLVSLRNKVEEAFSTMDVYMKKRSDLIPNLVNVVKGYAEHESKVLKDVTDARVNATSRDEKIKAENQITKALGNIIAVAENYPDLKANQNYLELQEQLAQVEDDIASSRRYYNGSVRELNTKIQSFPGNLIAGMFGFKTATMFQATESERQTVAV